MSLPKFIWELKWIKGFSKTKEVFIWQSRVLQVLLERRKKEEEQQQFREHQTKAKVSEIE